MINLRLFWDMDIWFKETSQSSGFITSKGLVTIFSQLVNFVIGFEVAFRKLTCFIRDLQGNDLLIGNHGSDLYTIELQESSSLTPIFFMDKASSSQAWLWHHRLSHLNFNTISLLSKKNIVKGLAQLKFVKDHLCSSCELGKAKRSTFKSKTTPSSCELGKAWMTH
ncbi:retrovirus-related pol polyprotein from transposon TNT 1-94 [Tanacetum coccineum]